MTTSEQAAGQTPSPIAEALTGFHVGRSFAGHRIEDECPCPQQPCGLVTPIEECPEHSPTAAKTTRQGHAAEQCPGAPAEAPA